MVVAAASSARAANGNDAVVRMGSEKTAVDSKWTPANQGRTTITANAATQGKKRTMAPSVNRVRGTGRAA